MLRGARSHSVVQPPVFKYKSKVTKNLWNNLEKREK